MRKVSITMDDRVEAGVRQRVGARGFSAYVNAAVERSLQADRLRGLLAEFEVEHGPIPEDVLAEIDEADWPA